MTKKSEVLRRWQLVSPYLHRKQQTVWAAAEAEVIGPSGCLMLANVTGISIPTLTKWTYRLKLTGTAHAGSLVPPKGCVGSGRKLTEVNNPEIEPALQQMLLEEIAGDPMGPQTWVRSSLRNLSNRLGDQVIKLALTQSLGCSAKWDTHYKLPRRSRQVHSTLIVTSNSNTSLR